MRRSNLARVRRIEEGRGAQCLRVELPDGSMRSFNLTRSDRATLLVSCFNMELHRRNPETPLTASARAQEIIGLIRAAVRITPPSRLWRTIGFQGGKNESE